MKLKVKRVKNLDTCTIGKLYIDDVYFCDTLEDLDRGLKDSMDIRDIKNKKVYGKTAIPKGEYEVTLQVLSPKFSTYEFYKEVCNGFLPRLLNVKGFDGILIHVADGYKKDKLLSGCIGVGDSLVDGSLTNGKETFKKLYEKLKIDRNNITIKIE